MYTRLFAIPARPFPGPTRLLALACFVLFLCSSPLLGADCKNTTGCDDLTAIPVDYLTIHGVSACNSDGSCDDPRATCQSGQCNVALTGYLYLPSLTAPHGGFPAIIFNHGSNSAPPHTAARACGIVKYFLARNYVVFTPARRGYSPSTGTYFNELPDPLAALIAEKNDVKAAFDHLAGAAGFINPNKIAIMGHSLGGIVTIFANEMDFGQRVAIPIAAGSESWVGNQELRDALIASVPNAKHYTYFFEPLNDVSTAPTIELSHIAGINGQQYEATIFPPVSYATTGEQAHACFVLDTKQVKKWGKTVIDFLVRYGIK